jgi:hypothetical protein
MSDPQRRRWRGLGRRRRRRHRRRGMWRPDRLARHERCRVRASEHLIVRGRGRERVRNRRGRGGFSRVRRRRGMRSEPRVGGRGVHRPERRAQADVPVVVRRAERIPAGLHPRRHGGTRTRAALCAKRRLRVVQRQEKASSALSVLGTTTRQPLLAISNRAR